MVFVKAEEIFSVGDEKMLRLLMLAVILFIFWKMRKIMQPQKKASKKTQYNNTIFVILISMDDGENLSETLYHLYDKATYPERVFVGAITYSETFDSCKEDFCNFSSEKDLTKFSTNIHIEHFPLSKYRGRPFALSRAMKRLYNNERFIMIAESSATFVQGWDTKAITFLPDFSVFTTIPPYHGHHQPTFIAFKQFNNAVPEFETIGFESSPSRPHKSLFFSSSFAFGPSEAFTGLLDYAPYKYLTYEADFWIGAKMYTLGFDLMAPPFIICTRSKRKSSNLSFKKRQRRKQSIELLKALHITDAKRTYNDYIKFCGLSVLGKSAKYRAFFGMHKYATNEEISHKFGSKERFDFLKSQL